MDTVAVDARLKTDGGNPPVRAQGRGGRGKILHFQRRSIHVHDRSFLLTKHQIFFARDSELTGALISVAEVGRVVELVLLLLEHIGGGRGLDSLEVLACAPLCHLTSVSCFDSLEVLPRAPVCLLLRQLADSLEVVGGTADFESIRHGVRVVVIKSLGHVALYILTI
jgi:hypothetical protein